MLDCSLVFALVTPQEPLDSESYFIDVRMMVPNRVDDLFFWATTRWSR